MATTYRIFGPNIQYIDGVDNIVADITIILLYTYVDKYEPSTSNSQCRANFLFVIFRDEKKESFSPLGLLNVQREKNAQEIGIPKSVYTSRINNLVTTSKPLE